MKPVVNFDWLELYCTESSDRALDPFSLVGYDVRIREYGTPQYSQMYTIYVEGSPWLEVRRLPYSVRSKSGVMIDGACHIRLCNVWCYVPNVLKSVRQFLVDHNVQFVNISRVDLCCDFVKFTHTDLSVQDFVHAYMRSEFFKEFQPRVRAVCDKRINQRSTIMAFGTDSPRERVWNSLSWGSTLSFIKTRLYNKSYEMLCEKPKDYIKSIWRQAGWDGKQEVWRLEFEIKANATFVSTWDGDLYKISLHDLENYQLRALWFNAFALRYFRFRKREYTRQGTVQRKDRSTLVQPLRVSNIDMEMKPYTPDLRKDPSTKQWRAWKVLHALEDEVPASLLKDLWSIKNWLWSTTSIELETPVQ